MSRYTIERPPMMDGIDEAKHNPRVIIACLIALAIYFAYNIAASFIGGIYLGIQIVNDASMLTVASEPLFSAISSMLLTQPFVIILLFSMVLLIGFVIIQVRAIDKRKLRTIGLVKKDFVKQYLLGVVFGTLFLLVLLLPTLASEYKNVVYNGITPLVFVFLFAFMIQSAAEEILFRGYLMTTVSRRIGMFWAVVVSSAVFAALHIINGDITILMLVQIFLLGSLFAFYMIRKNSIWGAFALHFAWNFMQGLFSKLEISFVKLDYRIFTFKGVSFEPDTSNSFGSAEDLIPIAILLVAIAIVLFVGENRIVVKKDQNDEFEF